MEKRWCERIPVSFEVIIHYHGARLARCTVRNISLCGISLMSGPLAFYRNTPIQIQILNADQVIEGRDKLNAVVIRNSPDGIGLMFSPTEPELLRSLIRKFRNRNQHTVASRRL